ncbi:hypothetical protein [Mycobacterium gallinarum]|nr:hypothetical protein [Mycobacterium gallinarum]
MSMHLNASQHDRERIEDTGMVDPDECVGADPHAVHFEAALADE